jgi:hypothetical protein
MLRVQLFLNLLEYNFFHLSFFQNLIVKIAKYSKNYLPQTARLLLLSTFIDDGYRMIADFTSQSTHIADLWQADVKLGNIFVLYNMIFQLVPCLMVLLRKHVNVACLFLFTNVIMQAIVYDIYWEPHYLSR